MCIPENPPGLLWVECCQGKQVRFVNSTPAGSTRLVQVLRCECGQEWTVESVLRPLAQDTRKRKPKLEVVQGG